MRVVLALAVGFAAVAAPAHAAWYQASSRHFLIYSEQKPATLRQFAEELEKFDSAVRFVRRMDDLPPSQGNRLTIFVFRHPDLVQKLAKDRSGLIEGFYRGRMAGSVAYVTLGDSAPSQEDAATGSNIARSSDAVRADTTLLHEYAHHLMFQDVARPYPQWLVEGFAEFMSTAQFEPDGSVGLGLPDKQRYAGLLVGNQLPLTELIPGKYDKLSEEEFESVYGRGWLLTHYLTFEPSRKGQLERFVGLLSTGADSLEAARQAFGDLPKLDHELDAYLQRSRLQYVKISGAALKVGAIEVSKLSAAASDAIPFVAALKNDPDPPAAQALANSLASLEQRDGVDAFDEIALAEAEFDAKKFDAAEAAADRALAADPASVQAMVLKGRAKIERLAASKAPAAEFTETRSWFLKANNLDPEDPQPLFEFYNSFVKQGISPNVNAIAALHYASDLAPQDEGVRLMSASQYLADDKIKEGRAALIAVAYDPHGGEVAGMARQMIDRIDARDIRGAMKLAGWRFPPGS